MTVMQYARKIKIIIVGIIVHLCGYFAVNISGLERRISEVIRVSVSRKLRSPVLQVTD